MPEIILKRLNTCLKLATEKTNHTGNFRHMFEAFSMQFFISSLYDGNHLTILFSETFTIEFFHVTFTNMYKVTDSIKFLDFYLPISFYHLYFTYIIPLLRLRNKYIFNNFLNFQVISEIATKIASISRNSFQESEYMSETCN